MVSGGFQVRLLFFKVTPKINFNILGVLMAQFRLTKKFSIDCKINNLLSPSNSSSIFDDWFIDTVVVQRKKVAMATHSKSLLTFLLPYAQVGGAKSVPACISVMLKKFLYENDLEVNEKHINYLFSTPAIFCQTSDRKVLGHMSDFKHCVEVRACIKYSTSQDIDWDEIMCSINGTPIGTREYRTPTSMAIDMFGSPGIAEGTLVR
jgi:hypothetical protein